MQDVAARAGIGPHVAGFGLAAQGRARLCRTEAGIHRHGGLLFGIEDPVAVLLGQLAPRAINVVAQRYQDVAQVLPMPGRRP
ncbi:hypothetical protein D3C81_2096520 [compost metagenome]